MNAFLGSRFTPIRLLKQGAGVSTWLAQDGDLQVILKTASRSTLGGAWLRIHHEAQVLQGLESRWVAPILEVGASRDCVYLAQPFFEGQTLQERLSRGVMDPTETLLLAEDLARALVSIHAHGILHRDLKPANLIWHEGHLKILDFGLARHSLGGEAEVGAGTASYVSPEQAGLLDFDVSDPTDLYAAGLILYECLSGRVARSGTTLGEVLREHLTPLARLDVPDLLGDIVVRLTRCDPRERYQTAEGFLADVEAARREETSWVVGCRDRRQSLASPPFVGRSAELAQCRTWLDQLTRGQGGLALIEAPSGGGKSFLLRQLALEAARRHIHVYRGQARPDAHAFPLEPLNRCYPRWGPFPCGRGSTCLCPCG